MNDHIDLLNWSKKVKDDIELLLKNNKKNIEIINVQISPYPPEAGSNYHKILCKYIATKLNRPVIVLSGVTYLPYNEAIKKFGFIHKEEKNIIYRGFWSPRLISSEYKKRQFNLNRLLKSFGYIIKSIRTLSQVIILLKKKSYKVVVHIHYRFSTWPGGIFGEHYILAPIFARINGAKVVCTIHDFVTPHQFLTEALEKKIPKIIALSLLGYYLIVVRIATSTCHKVMILTNSKNAPILHYIKKILALKKIKETVHPYFHMNCISDPYESKKYHYSKKQITIFCPGYIRKEKGYHILINTVYKLSKTNHDFADRINVIIAGSIDRKKIEDILYLREILSVVNNQKVKNVNFIIRHLNEKELEKLLSNSDIVWCIYNKQYGPSGILALARGCNKKVLYPKNALWGHAEGEAPDFDEHVNEILMLYTNL